MSDTHLAELKQQVTEEVLNMTFDWNTKNSLLQYILNVIEVAYGVGRNNALKAAIDRIKTLTSS